MTDTLYASPEPSSGKSRPFGAFEWLLAMRYLRARRREGFISVIAGFSFAGIMLGVATLIIVMSVMNGFRTELLSKILGLNGHMFVRGIGMHVMNYDEMAANIAELPGVTGVMPLVEGQVMVSSAQNAGGAIVRGMRERDLKSLRTIADSVILGSLDGFDEGGVVIGSRLAQSLALTVGDNITLLSPRGAITPSAPRPVSAPIRSSRSSNSACRNTMRASSSCRSTRRAIISAPSRASARSKSASTIPIVSTRSPPPSAPPPASAATC